MERGPYMGLRGSYAVAVRLPRGPLATCNNTLKLTRGGQVIASLWFLSTVDLVQHTARSLTRC